jgi:lipopolysaccharide/colanic/teichoic acid biosynthesis glycosyltransferase
MTRTVNNLQAREKPAHAGPVFKRTADLLLSSLSLAALAPVFLAVSAAVKLTDGGPVFFVQQRMGRDFRPFQLFKFRTMSSGSDEGPCVTAVGDERVTRVGRFLRRTKLDELPQLLNIIKGDMSLVGPRPEVYRYARFYEKDFREILNGVRPGLTDYATLEFIGEEEILGSRGNAEETYLKEILPAKLELCRRYSLQAGIRTDTAIIARTLYGMLKRLA